MNTNEFARILLTWIKSFLSWIGIPRDRLKDRKSTRLNSSHRT